MSKKSQQKQSLLNRVFNKAKPMSAQLPDQSRPDPRAKDDIQREYQNLCTALGDKTVKSEGIKQEIEGMLRRVSQLGAELAERERLDAESASKSEAINGSPVKSESETKPAQESIGAQ